MLLGQESTHTWLRRPSDMANQHNGPDSACYPLARYWRDEAASSRGVAQSVNVVGAKKDNYHTHASRQWAAKQNQSTLLLPIAGKVLPELHRRTAAPGGRRSQDEGGRGTLSRSARMHTLRRASELSSNWVGELVGSQFACELYQDAVVGVMLWGHLLEKSVGPPRHELERFIDHCATFTK